MPRTGLRQHVEDLEVGMVGVPRYWETAKPASLMASYLYADAPWYAIASAATIAIVGMYASSRWWHVRSYRRGYADGHHDGFDVARGAE